MLVNENEFMKILSEIICEIPKDITYRKLKVFSIILNMFTDSDELASVLLRYIDKDIKIIVNKSKSEIIINSDGKSIKYESEIDNEKVLRKLLHLIDLIHSPTTNYSLYLRIDFFENNEVKGISR